MLHIFLSFILSIAFIGCSKPSLLSLKQTTSQHTTPKWYLLSPNNNTLFIYGTGEGDTKEEAKNNALNEMASKLVVSVGSSLKTTTKVSDDSYSKNIQRDVKIDIQKIKFINAKIEKIVQIGDKFYILLKVNRIELFEQKRKEFDINDERVTKQYNSISSYAKLEKIKILQNISPDLINGKQQALILNAINNDFNQAPYMKKYDSYLDEIYNLKKSSSIYVSTNNKHRYFADSLIEMLNQKQYKIGEDKNSDIKIKINNKIKYSIARGWNIAKVITTLSVISNGKTISNKNISTLGRSSTSKESALESAAKQFTIKIKKDGLDKIVFGF